MEAKLKTAIGLPVIHGTVVRSFEDIKSAFTQNFARMGEVGAACADYYRGEKVKDLWGATLFYCIASIQQ